MGSLDRLAGAIAQLAASQHGHVTREQLLGLGVPSSTIGRWIASGRLIPVHAGVFAVGYPRREPVARAAAAVLACGPTAVLSHGSAAGLWGLRPTWPFPPEVTIIGDRRPRDVRVHRSRTLTPSMTTTELGVRTTTAERTLSDIRPRLPAERFTRLVNRARLDGHLTFTAADALLLGAASAQPTKSGHEDALWRWFVRQDLPMPLINVRSPAGYEVDAYYPGHGVILEIDDYATHGDRATFASDRERDAAHTGLGLLTVRLLREWLTAREAARVRAILDRRDGWSSSPHGFG